MARRPRTLLISENASVPSDRRVWNECRTLAGAGWDVVVVCPQGADRDRAAHETIEGIEIHRYAEGGPQGYAREYLQAMWRIGRLARACASREPFDVVHAANPPDVLLLAVRGLRRDGTRRIFDHHDLVPELYQSRFGVDRRHPAVRATLAAERLAFRLTDVSIATNDSYRRVAIERGGMDPADVFVVRNGPDLSRFGPVAPDPALRRGHEHLIAYLGVMGPQDGIDHALGALAELHGSRQDWHAIFVGDGDVIDAMRRRARDLGIGDAVEFAGWRGDDDIRRILSTADVCLAPDPPSPLNERSTMMKIPEYLAMGRPVASYDLPESRVSAGEAALFATPGDQAALAGCVDTLLSDPGMRDRMGRIGRDRVERLLAWEHSAAQLLAAYERVLRRPPRVSAA